MEGEGGIENLRPICQQIPFTGICQGRPDNYIIHRKAEDGLLPAASEQTKVRFTLVKEYWS